MQTLPEIPLPSTPKAKKRKQPKDPTYLLEGEIEMFFRLIRDVRDRALFRLMYHRGLRASEPAKLTMSDYRPGPGRPRLLVHRLKGSVSAEDTLCDGEVAALKAWLRVRGPRPGPLFPSRNRKPISRERIWELMRHYCALAGIPKDKAHPHAPKHACGTHLVPLLNGNVVAIQQHLGHADIRNTMRYLRASNREARGDALADWGKRRAS